jgi:hypothetical protein
LITSQLSASPPGPLCLDFSRPTTRRPIIVLATLTTLPKCGRDMMKLSVDGVYSYQTSYGFARGQIPCHSQGTLLPSSGEPKVSNLWNNVQHKGSI